MCKFNKRILFVGIPDMAIICLEGLTRRGVNIVGVVGPKKNHDTYLMFKNFSSHLGLNYIEYDELDDVNFINNIKSLKPDLAVVCSFNYKIPKALLKTTKDGFVNVHPSLLPKYRGANPYSAVIFNGEKETGLTLHFMDETFDTGDVLMQKSINIFENETMGTLFNRFNILALDMLAETLEIYEKKKLPRKKQENGNYPKAPALSDDNCIINYSNSAQDIERQVRGLNPFLIARTSFRQNIVRIFSAEYSQEDVQEGNYGQIVKLTENNIFIKTKQGLLMPTTMQFGSYFIGSSKDFIKILNPQLGERFN